MNRKRRINEHSDRESPQLPRPSQESAEQTVGAVAMVALVGVMVRVGLWVTR